MTSQLQVLDDVMNEPFKACLMQMYISGSWVGIIRLLQKEELEHQVSPFPPNGSSRHDTVHHH
jgi:hypothetical protein